MQKMELAPGIQVQEENGKYQLWIRHNNQDVIGWDFQEVSHSPKAWIESVKAVIFSLLYGTEAMQNKVEKSKSKLKSVPDLFCNVCGRQISAKDANFCFSAKLNGKVFRDYQCSFECNKRRKEQVLYEELGKDFFQLWSDKFHKTP